MAADISNILPDKFMSHLGSDKDVDERVLRVYKALHKYASSDARHEWLRKAKRDKKAALENEFFTDEEKVEIRDMGAEPHVINKLVKGIQGSSAIATANRPDIKVLPLRESDPYLAELAKSALEHVWLKNYGSSVVYDMVEERNLSGAGAISARLDKNRGPFGVCVFEEDDATLWYWDENSKKRDRSDTHLIKAQLRSVAYIKSNYDIKDDDIISVDDDLAQAGSGEREDTKTSGDNYKHGAKSKAPQVEGPRRVWEIEAYMRKTEKEHWAIVVQSNGRPVVVRFHKAKSKKDAEAEIEKIKGQGLPSPGEDGFVPVASVEYWPRRMVNRYMYIIVGTKLIPQEDNTPGAQEGAEVDEVRNPEGVDSDGDPVLPVVFYYAQRTTKAYYRSPTFYAFGPNKALCKRESQYTLAISKNLSAPVMREDTGTKWRDPKRPDRPGNELLLSKSARVPTRLPPGVVDFGALASRTSEDKMDIDEAYGLSEVVQGKVPQGLERMSGRLSLALQENTTLMQSPAISGLEETLERLGKLLLSIIIRSWTREKWESLVTEDRVQEFRPVQDPLNEQPDSDKSDEMKIQDAAARMAKWQAAIDKITMDGISIVDFNVAITAGSSLPTNRLLKEETAMEMYKIGLNDRQAALEYSGDPHAKEIAARMDAREMQMVQAGAKPK